MVRAVGSVLALLVAVALLVLMDPATAATASQAGLRRAVQRKLLNPRRVGDTESKWVDKVCVKNKMGANIEYYVKNESTGGKTAKQKSYPTGETKCHGLKGNQNDLMHLHVTAVAGKSKDIQPTFYYGSAAGDCTFTYDCSGSTDSYSCSWKTTSGTCTDPVTTPAPTPQPTATPKCNDAVIQAGSLVWSNVQVVDGPNGAAVTCCNATEGDPDTTFSCTNSFAVTQAVSETVSVSSSVGLSFTGTLKFSETEGVATEDESFSLTLSETYTEGEATTVSVTTAITNSCGVTIEGSDCKVVTADYFTGTLTADWTADIVCDDGSTVSGAVGTVEGTNLASSGSVTGCTEGSCTANTICPGQNTLIY